VNPYSDLPFWWRAPPPWWRSGPDLYPPGRYQVELRCWLCGGTNGGDGRHDWHHSWTVS
jgi:hypothetical protein